jgi:hypothetical protein
MRLQIEPTTEGELDLPPAQLLSKLEAAFVELGDQLLKGTRHREHGEIDVLEDLYKGMQQSYAARLKRLREELERSA